MTDFQLDARLSNDCYELGALPLCKVLLMDNGSVPWFILVPVLQATELTDLGTADQQQLLAEINLLAGFLQTIPSVEKLNIAALGNVVSQLHVHVIGRNKDDACWPDPVWGRLPDAPYDPSDAKVMCLAIADHLGSAFIPEADVLK